MDEERRQWLLEELRFLFPQQRHDEEFDLDVKIGDLIELYEVGPEYLKKPALYQVLVLYELSSADRSDAIENTLELARAGVRCCANPLCPINFAIDVATAALAEVEGQEEED